MQHPTRWHIVLLLYSLSSELAIESMKCECYRKQCLREEFLFIVSFNFRLERREGGGVREREQCPSEGSSN